MAPGFIPEVAMNRAKHRMCQGKKRHASREHARVALRETMNTFGELGLVFYWCPHCKGYHVGHAPKSEQKRLKTQRLIERIEWANRKK